MASTKLKINRAIMLALVGALAVCGSLMFMTADGNDVYENVKLTAAKIGGPASVTSTDVQKAGEIYTNTPDGRISLYSYLENVEKEISAEEAARKRDVAAVRSQMARNFAFNQAARKKLKKALLHKMAINAKKAHSDMVRAMRYVQGRFARAAALANRRNAANIRRSKAIRARVARDKAHAAHQLRTAVLAQQRAMSTLKASVNARIAQTNKHVAANAAQIKENAKAARAALEAAVHKFDHKLANARAEAAKGRSKLAAQLVAQDKATRAWASNKLKVVAASTAAQFRKVRAKMAADRAHVDAAVKSATSRMSASLNAFKALNSKRFAKTVKNINAAKAAAAKMIAKAQTGFKASILALRSTVKQQVAKTNARVTQLSGVVQKNKLEQAKVNANVNAEMKRMVKLGNKRYKEHLKKDAELKHLIQANKAATDRRMNAMAAHYNSELDKVRAVMRKNRAHATRELAKHSAKLYAAIAKQQKQQMLKNKALAAQTRSARLAVADELRSAKRDFSKRLAALHATIVHNDKKFDGKIKKLTGVVNANAVKSANGRKVLAAMMKANKAQLLGAVSHAVHLGEKRMMKAEQRLKDMSQKTKASLNMRITSEISKLASGIHSSIEGLRLNSKSARAEMKREMLYAVRSAAAQAKKNLAAAVRVAKVVFSNVAKAEDHAAKKNKAARASIARKLRVSTKAAQRSISDAVAGMTRAMLALKSETAKKIKKTNKTIDAHAKQMAANSKAITAAMKANVAALTAKIDAAKKAAKHALHGANAASIARQVTVLTTLKRSMMKARAKAHAKFGKAYAKLAKNRAHADTSLGSAVDKLNDGIAKQAALADSRFSKTVKNLGAARKQAAAQVKAAGQAMSTAIYAVTSTVKDQETRLSGEIAVVSGEVISNRAEQIRVNRRTAAELSRIIKLSNKRHSMSSRARGKLRKLLNENKRAAAEQVAALAASTRRSVIAIRSQAARNAQDAAKDLTKATQRLYGKLAHIQLEAAMSNRKTKKNIKSFGKKTAAALAIAKKGFSARLTSLTNTVVANYKTTEEYLAGLTGVIRSNKLAAKKDRRLIKIQTKAMHADLNKKLVRAIQIGEARAKKVADVAREHLKAAKKAMLIEISERVESMADKLFKSIQGNHKKIADNYLSLKAYAAAAAPRLKAYVAKGKGRNLSAMGDLLDSIALLAPVKPGKAEGVGAGLHSVRPIFGGPKVKVSGAVSKINALVNEYIGVVTAVRRRWPMGLGKYLLMKAEEGMQRKGVLQVDKVSGHAGNWVFLNAHSIGLSNKVSDFESLGVRLHHYEHSLAKLTAKVAHKKKRSHKKKILMVKPPEWKGN